MSQRSALKGWAVFIAVAALPAILSAQPSAQYWVNFPKDVRGWAVTLPAPFEGAAYRDAMTAIDLKTVVCDGVNLAAETYLIADRPDKTAVSLGGGNIVYQLSQGFFQCWVDLQAKGQSNKIRHFDLPKSAKVIEVQYRVRTPDGRTSNVMTVTFSSSDEKTHIFVAP